MPDKDYGCDDCPKLKGNRCEVWEVKVADPHNSHCEAVTYWINQEGKREQASVVLGKA
jgi:hypothetical protein